MTLPQTVCVASLREQQNFKTPHNFTIFTHCFDEASAVAFLQKASCVKMISSKFFLHNSRILSSHLTSFFCLPLKTLPSTE